jgi:hypothetical protein
MRRKHRRLSTIVMLMSLTTLSTTTGRAASPVMVMPATITTQEDTAKVEPLADGTKNPAAVPDAVALRVLFLTTSAPANPTATQTRRLQAKLGRMNLGQPDMTIFEQRLRAFDALATAQKARIADAREAGKRNPTTAAVAGLVAADGQMDTLLANAYSELRQSLSPEGAAKLQEHLAYIKTKIKVLPPPKMTMPHH